jgi:hypothetical protein
MQIEVVHDFSEEPIGERESLHHAAAIVESSAPSLIKS